MWRPCAPQTSVFLERIGPRTPRSQKSAVLYYFLCADFENHCKHRLKVEIVRSDWSFWASRCGFVALSKTSAKPVRNSKYCIKKPTLCTRVRTRDVLLKFIFRKRLWLERVCKVRARHALLLRFHSVFCVGAVLGPFWPWARFLVIFFEILRVPILTLFARSILR